MKFLLIGNQNSGKTTLFNTLTGSNLKTGNYIGVTVGKQEKKIKFDLNSTVIDLPGVYSLNPTSNDELLTKTELLNTNYDCIINVVDSVNAVRNFYATTMLLELNKPMIIALNFYDEFTKKGGKSKVKELENLLKIPVVPIVAYDIKSVQNLISKAKHARKPTDIFKYYNMPKLLKKDDFFNENLDNNLFVEVVNTRYDFIENNLQKYIFIPQKNIKKEGRLDNFFLNKYLSVFIFFAIMFCIFYLTFNLIGESLSLLTNSLLKFIFSQIIFLLNILKLPNIIITLFENAIFTGVYALFGFLPYILILFLLLSLLEYSGYTARIAFIFDSLMRPFKLSGKAVVSLILGFGCSVPAIASTKTLENKKERFLTALLVPFFPCSAKIPLITMVACVLFNENKFLFVLISYIVSTLIGLVVIFITSKIIKCTNSEFCLELPPYRTVPFKKIVLDSFLKVKNFTKRSGILIILFSVLLWFLNSFSFNFTFCPTTENTMLFTVSKIIAPIFYPLGIKNGELITSLLFGIFAKEAVASSLSIFNLTNLLNLIPIKSLMAFLLFFILYTPCVSTIITFKKEFNYKCIGLIFPIFYFIVAYICTFIAYNLIFVFF